ncbi:MAG: glycerol-3-phosphate 1-O-acyltransferase PlsY [Planctomycetes bacterium]|nr:glycerol-3-phosphate 1-O-acyltransferase PlsY [Planctomycetota bacterium]
MHWLAASVTVVVSYFIGAIPFGYVVAWMRGVNIFEQGSGNIGATNVGRILGWQYGALVFVLDFAKGAIPVALALVLKPNFEEPVWSRGFVEVTAGLIAFLGHLFPVYLRFQGGKGVASGCGAVAVLLPVPTLMALAAWSVLLVTTRLMSLASIAAVFALCAAQLRQPAAWDWLEPRTWFCIVAGTLVIAKHHANIGRLFQGTENQLEDTTMMQQLNRSLHVLALGLWFGMAIFFTFVVAFSLFGSFEAMGKAEKRETWFPRVGDYLAADELVDGPKEQGTRAAGFAIGPMFTWYFALQGVCGFIALATALAFLSEPGGVHRWRVNLLLAAVALVLVGWPLERKVHELREPRNRATEVYLLERTDKAHGEAASARATFGQWHLASVFVNLAAILCVAGAMALAGNLPTATPVNDEKSATAEPAQTEAVTG